MCYHLYPISTLLFCSVGICTLQDGSICDEDKSWVDCEVADRLKDCEVLKEPGNIMKDKKYNTVRTKTNKQTNKQDKSWVDCEVKDGLENCEVLKEPGNIIWTRNTSL